MKPVIPMLYIFLLFSCGICCGQHNPMRPSDVIIEGHVIEGKSFKTRTSIYTSVTIRILKIFKGNITDSLIEVVEEGGSIDGQQLDINDGTVGASLNDEGIFFLDSNKTGATLKSNLLSYSLASSFIGYRFGPVRVGNHLATCKGVTYDDIEKDLYEPIEAATGQKRKVLGKNGFEIEAAKKQKK